MLITIIFILETWRRRERGGDDEARLSPSAISKLLCIGDDATRRSSHKQAMGSSNCLLLLQHFDVAGTAVLSIINLPARGTAASSTH